MDHIEFDLKWNPLKARIEAFLNDPKGKEDYRTYSQLRLDIAEFAKNKKLNPPQLTGLTLAHISVKAFFHSVVGKHMPPQYEYRVTTPDVKVKHYFGTT